MTTQAAIGYGAIFEMHNGATYVTIGEVTNITLPNLSREAVDATHTESEGGWREFIPGLKDAGEVTIEMNFVFGSTSDELIRAQFDTDALSQCRITVPGPASPDEQITFNAIVTNYEVELPVDGKQAATLTMKVSGVVDYEPGA